VHVHVPSHLGEHPHRVRRRDLRDVDDLVALEDAHVGRLPDLGGQTAQVWHRPRGQSPSGHLPEPDQPGSQRVAAGRLLADVAVVGQRAEQPVDGGQRKAARRFQLLQPERASGVTQQLQQLQRAVQGLDAASRLLRDRCCARLLWFHDVECTAHVDTCANPPLTSTSQTSHSASWRTVGRGGQPAPEAPRRRGAKA
jgi:hypothetical protein